MSSGLGRNGFCVGPVGHYVRVKPSASDIEASLALPAATVDAAMARAEEQDRRRGSWPSPRAAAMPNPPWPHRDSAMLKFLLAKARASIDAGMDIDTALLQLATHAWFEGGIEGYDRGQADARRPRATD